MAARIGIEAKLYYSPLLDPADGTPWLVPAPTTPWPPANGTLPTDANNGTPAQPMIALDNCRNVGLNMSKTVADITTRGGNGWRQVLGAIKDGSVDFEMVWDSADPGFANVSHAFFQNKPLFCGVMDGDGEDSAVGYRIQGLYAPFTVLDLSRDEGLENALVANVSIQPTFVSGYNPEWVDRVNS